MVSVEGINSEQFWRCQAFRFRLQLQWIVDKRCPQLIPTTVLYPQHFQPITATYILLMKVITILRTYCGHCYKGTHYDDIINKQCFPYMSHFLCSYLNVLHPTIHSSKRMYILVSSIIPQCSPYTVHLDVLSVIFY